MVELNVNFEELEHIDDVVGKILSYIKENK